MTPQEIAIAAIEEASHEDDPVDIAVTYRIALEQIAQGGWVPVSERLPEERTYVLVTDACRDEDWVPVVRKDYHIAGVWTYDVTAWMPLPEAYKEATDETD